MVWPVRALVSDCERSTFGHAASFTRIQSVEFQAQPKVKLRVQTQWKKFRPPTEEEEEETSYAVMSLGVFVFSRHIPPLGGYGACPTLDRHALFSSRREGQIKVCATLCGPRRDGCGAHVNQEMFPEQRPTL